jgi:hypothetical protein
MKKCLRPRKLGLRQFFIFEGLDGGIGGGLIFASGLRRVMELNVGANKNSAAL